MPLQTKSKEQFLSDTISAWAGRLGLKPYLPSGDPFRAMFEAYVLAGFLFLQHLIVRVFKLARASTSEAEDLDSWMADFSFARKPATKANGSVRFSVRSVLSTNVLIPPGVEVQTLDGKIKYQVIADPNKPTWSVTFNSYVLTAGQLSLDASVQALKEGSGSNVQIGALSQIASSIPGISFVTNPAAISNGRDTEKDQAYRDRFKLFINAVNKKTTPVGYYSAALDVPGVTAVKVIEFEDIYGNPRKAYVLVVVDDGSGTPTPDLIAEVTKAIAGTNAPARGAGVEVLVIGPTLAMVSLALNVRVAEEATSPSTVRRAVEDAVINYVNSLSIGDPLYLQNLVSVAKNADPLVVAVQTNSVFINGTEADYLGSKKTVIRTNNTIVSVGEW